LDADITPAVAARLRERGYDVISTHDPNLVHMSDDSLLIEATRQGRALATYNVRDYVQLSRQLAHAEKEHAGILLIHSKSIPQSDIGGLVEALEQLLRNTHDAHGLRNVTMFLPRQQD
jgi:hypothetical protein